MHLDPRLGGIGMGFISMSMGYLIGQTVQCQVSCCSIKMISTSKGEEKITSISMQHDPYSVPTPHQLVQIDCSSSSLAPSYNQQSVPMKLPARLVLSPALNSPHSSPGSVQQ